MPLEQEIHQSRNLRTWLLRCYPLGCLLALGCLLKCPTLWPFDRSRRWSWSARGETTWRRWPLRRGPRSWGKLWSGFVPCNTWRTQDSPCRWAASLDWKSSNWKLKQMKKMVCHLGFFSLLWKYLCSHTVYVNHCKKKNVYCNDNTPNRNDWIKRKTWV